MHDLTSKQIDFLKCLFRHSPKWITRKAMVAETGHPKGYSKALGAPRKRVIKPETLEGRGYVERRDENMREFEYRITEAGKLALSADWTG